MSWHQASHTKDRPFCCPEHSFSLFVVVLGDPHPVIPRAIDPSFLHETKFEDEVLRHLLLKKWCKLPEQALQDDEAHEQEDPTQVSHATGSRQVELHNRQDVSVFDPVYHMHMSLYVSDCQAETACCNHQEHLRHNIWTEHTSHSCSTWLGNQANNDHLPEPVCIIWVQPK